MKLILKRNFMNETIKTIKNRRSVRSFKSEPIKEEELKTILEAGLYAPSAGNKQSWHFTVIRNKDIIDELNASTKEAVKKTSEERYVQLANNEKFHIFYNAPAVIIVSGEEKASMPQVDCAAATENILLAAESLGIGSCWIGFTAFLFSGDNGNKYNKELKIPAGYKPYYSIALGYKSNGNALAPERRTNTVSYI
jgi:nitroreductase